MKNKIIIVFLIVLVVVSLVRISKYIYSEHLEESKTEKNDIEQVVNKEKEVVREKDIIIFLIENIDYLKDIYDLEIVEKKENVWTLKFLDKYEKYDYFMTKIKLDGKNIEIIEIYSVAIDFEGETDSCAPNCSY